MKDVDRTDRRVVTRWTVLLGACSKLAIYSGVRLGAGSYDLVSSLGLSDLRKASLVGDAADSTDDEATDPPTDPTVPSSGSNCWAAAADASECEANWGKRRRVVVVRRRPVVSQDTSDFSSAAPSPERDACLEA